MSFVRAKEIPPHSGNLYDYEVKTVHEGGKVTKRNEGRTDAEGTRAVWRSVLVDDDYLCTKDILDSHYCFRMG